MKYFCNPINIDYRYQFNKDPRVGKLQICREAADPSLIKYKGRYYIFASMQLKVWVSDDLINWESYKLPNNLPLYDYAPDVRVIGDYVYFSASSRDNICDYYKTKDIINGPYEKIEGTFSFWDPNIFEDDDGRIYFYWGCSNTSPIYGVEVDRETLKPLGEKKELIFGHPFEIGYERVGNDNSKYPKSDEEIEMLYQGFVKKQGVPENMLPDNVKPLIRGMLSDKPYIEGAWLNKINGKYYFQYAAPGTQYNTYSDGVYIADNPLGPFVLADNNPFSYLPGGFMTGAGHGSTLVDDDGKIYHTSTMQISVNHDFERRVGIWPSFIDEDGQLVCDQRYGDWPIDLNNAEPFKDPDYYLLSYKKEMKASSCVEGHEPLYAADENSKTWWRANSNKEGQWLKCDLGQTYNVKGIQINFADDVISDQEPQGEIKGISQARWIDDRQHKTRWYLEASLDDINWFMLKDKSKVTTDLAHDYIDLEEMIKARYIRLTIIEIPMNQNPCISGLRIFGKGNGVKPEIAKYEIKKQGDLDMAVEIENINCGYNILFGNSPDKLYHSYKTYETNKRIGALIKGREYYVRVDSFNENGITHGVIKKL